MFGSQLDAVVIPTQQAFVCTVRTNILQPGVNSRGKILEQKKKQDKKELGAQQMRFRGLLAGLLDVR
jgi:hypothetical protein